GVGDLDLQLESPRSQQCRVEAVGEVGGADHEHQLLLTKPVHLGEQLVHHRVLYATPDIRSALGGEAVEFVENDDRGGRFASAGKDLAQVFLRLTDPFALELRAGDDR